MAVIRSSPPTLTRSIVTSANRDLNPRRLERYLTTVWDSGAQPIIVLNKVDLVADAAEAIAAIAAAALGVPIVAASALTGQGRDDLLVHFGPGTTIGLIGSSGAEIVAGEPAAR